MNIRIFLVPYDSGFMNRGQGLGPACFLDSGLAGTLVHLGHQVEIERLVTAEECLTEVASAL